MPNKVTHTTRQMITALIDRNLDQAQIWLDRCAKRSPGMALKLLLELMSYGTPKLAAIAVEQRDPNAPQPLTPAQFWQQMADASRKHAPELAEKIESEQQQQPEKRLLSVDPPRPAPPVPRLTSDVEAEPVRAPLYETPAPPAADQPEPAASPTLVEAPVLEGELVPYDPYAAAQRRREIELKRAASQAFSRKHHQDFNNGLVRKRLIGVALDNEFERQWDAGWRP